MGRKSEINSLSHEEFLNRIHVINSGYPESFSAYPKPLLFSILEPSEVSMVDLVTIKDEVALYIHIPYCIKKCSFCFIDVVESSDKEIFSQYTDAIISEISHYKKQYPTQPIQTIYIGGGTPIIIGLENLGKIIHCIRSFFDIHRDAVWEIDATPTVLTETILKGLKDLSIHTLNIGIQSTEEKVLKNIGREWQSNRYVDIIGQKIKDYGFQVHLDFIIGLPGETITTFTKQLDHLYDVFQPASFSINIYEETVYSPDFFSKRKHVYPKHIFLSKIANLLETFLKNKYSLTREHTDYIEGFHRRGKSVIAFGAGAFGYIVGQGMYKNQSIQTYISNHFDRYYLPMTPHDERLMFLMNNASRDSLNQVYYSHFGSSIEDDFPDLILQERKYMQYSDEGKDYSFIFVDRSQMQKVFVKYYSENVYSLYQKLVGKKLSSLEKSFNSYYDTM